MATITVKCTAPAAGLVQAQSDGKQVSGQADLGPGNLFGAPGTKYSMRSARPRTSRSSTRMWSSFVLIAVTATACVTAPPYVPDGAALERQQWQTVQSEAPLVGEALLQSLLALEETDPFSAAQARQQAVDLARRAGVVTTPRLVCNACELPKNDGELSGHMACLRQRINCLHPR
jgi:hypothetical protein